MCAAASPGTHLRRLDVQRDLTSVADLIELCFAPTMDSDGFEYLRQLRRIARDTRLLRWIPGAGEVVPYPINGFVWEEEGVVVGNLTLVPHMVSTRWRYVIVNVAVHPNHRQKGIGGQLTRAGIDHVRRHGAASAWLQVRDDNPAAIHLYESLGFKERARRSTWRNSNHLIQSRPPGGVETRSRSRGEWQQQSLWLRQNYPSEIAWYLPFNLERQKPGLLNGLLGWMDGTETRHWSAWMNKEHIGSISWEPSQHSADNLWLAAAPPVEDLAVHHLLAYILENAPTNRPLSVNYPAGRAVQPLQACGFSLQNTLIWMEIPFS